MTAHPLSPSRTSRLSRSARSRKQGTTYCTTSTIAFAGLCATLYLLQSFLSPSDHPNVEAILRSQLSDGSNDSIDRIYTERPWPYCSADDIVHGVWQDTGRNFGQLAEVTQAYDLQLKAEAKCETDVTGPDADTKQLRRLLDVAAPVLRPVGNCKMVDVERMMVVRRLLRSASGLTIVGDAVSASTFQIWWDFLAAEPGLVSKTKHTDKHYDIRLNRRYQKLNEVTDAAGVSDERLQHPIVTFYRQDSVLSDTDLAEAMGKAGGDRVELMLESGIDDDHWFYRWSQNLAKIGRAGIKPDKEEPNLLLLNTGTTWTTRTLGKKITEDDVYAGYQEMFGILKEKIRAIPYPVASYWRSIAPAHLDCQASVAFNNSQADWASPVTGGLKSWNYHWYEKMNGIAEGNTVHYRSPAAWNLTGITSGWSLNPPIRYIDIWEMSLKRPDAHVNPPKDCLQYCSIGLMNHWQQLLWNVIVSEARNRDYIWRRHVA